MNILSAVDTLFLAGNILVIIATLLTFRDSNKIIKAISRLTFVAASLILLFSVTPLAPAFFRFYMLLVVLLIIALQLGSKTIAPGRNLLRIGIIATGIWLTNDMFKSNNIPSPLKPVSTIYIMGPSLTTSTVTPTWSSILAQQITHKSVNLTTENCTLNSLVDQARLIGEKDCTTILFPLTGQLTDTDPKYFSDALNTLLAELTLNDRTIIMAALPTAVWDKEYLALQKQLAKHYKVFFIPRSFIVSALQSSGIDSIDSLSVNEQNKLATLFAQQISH